MILLRVALALLVVGAVVPELSRYVAERRLYRATAVVRSVLLNPRSMPNPGGAVAWAASVAAGVARDLPGDWRPLNLVGTALLVTRQPGAALATYREAARLGERPEIVLNVGRAFASLGRPEEATAAFVRAAWVSPAMLASVPAATRAAVALALRDLEDKLAEGRLPAAPALPP